MRRILLILTLTGAASLPIIVEGTAAAAAQIKHCQHVRGYDDGTVTARNTSCHRAAHILWQARQQLDRSHIEGWKCSRRGVGPGGGFPVYVTCVKGSARTRGSLFDGPA